ncbi:hypothetical protein B0H10DRAFT_2443055 [Mycena sp. CBHHK59/15]|nr:hypothetical protein B0H10DRAFT_2443055 [Mycena sp. CBHHK59/15]
MALPLDTLETFRTMEFLGRDRPLPVVTALMLRLCSLSDLTIAMTLPTDHEVDGSFNVPPVVSAISTLVFEIHEEFSPDDARRALERFLASLTLPCLTGIFFHAIEYPPTPLPWPHFEFLSLSERSSFHAHLTDLALYEVIITESELLQCLAVLPALVFLSISDQPAVLPDHTEHLLITDTLLAALTKTTESPCLVPQLRIFGVQSILKFDDNVYLKFLLSRLQGEADQGPLVYTLRWFPGYKRALDDAVWAQLQNLRTQEVVFRFLPGPAKEQGG